LFAQTQLLSALGPRRDFELRTPINGRNINLSAQRRFRSAHRHSHINIITLTAKHRMLTGADDDVKIAGRAAAQSGIAFACQPDTLPIACTRLDAHLDWFGAVHHAFTVACWTAALR